MNRVQIFIIVVFSFLITSSIQAKEEYSVWIKVIDQNNEPIEQATVYYCIFDCILLSNSHNKKQTVTNAQGYAQLRLKAKGSLRIQGIKKETYDIRLQTYPYNNIKLTGASNSFKGYHRRGGYAGINISFENHKQAYSSSMSEPIITLTGWKLGAGACLEQDHNSIFHDGRAEQNWEISNKENYYLVGDENNTLRVGTIDNYDFKTSINRSHFPWDSIINKFIATYELVIDFKNGGAKEIGKTEYLHQAPNHGYKKQIKIKYRGIGAVITSHRKKYFIKINDRYGAINLWLVPTRKVFFEYLLHRKVHSINLNIPTFIQEHGVTDDYFTCGASAGVIRPNTTEPGACANLGKRKIGC